MTLTLTLIEPHRGLFVTQQPHLDSTWRKRVGCVGCMCKEKCVLCAKEK